MTKTELLNKLAQDGDQRLLLARTLDKLELTRTRNVPAHTVFLSLADRTGVEGLIGASGHPSHLFYGGYPEAERRICGFLPDWMEPEDWEQGEDCPLTAVEVTCPGGNSLTHRDYLGSILGLGITREKIGDLLVEPGRCQVILMEEVAHVLLSQLEQVGRCKAKISPLSLDQLTPPVQQRKTVRDTVATLRIDAVASSGFSLSRGKMADHISAGKVALNGRECTKPDRLVQEGDVITCRGLGKCILTEVSGLSKKGRVMILMERYI